MNGDGLGPNTSSSVLWNERPTYLDVEIEVSRARRLTLKAG